MKRLSVFALMFAVVLTTAMSAQQVMSPVADAAARGDKTTVKQLLKDGADVNGAQGDGKKRITLTRKQTTEIKAEDSTGKARTIQVEVRRSACWCAVTKRQPCQPLPLRKRLP